MHRLIQAIAVGLFLASNAAIAQDETASGLSPTAIAIHGGAGTISRESMTEEREHAIRDALEQAIRAGYAVLQRDGAAIDAVTAAITILEDAPEFNAGRGAVLTSESRVEMDASIMTGQDLAAGAVASVRGIRHPILAARAVLEHSPHVMLVGEGAEKFARGRQLEFMPEPWFRTKFRVEQLRRIQAGENEQSSFDATDEEEWFSTVGTVALDRAGNLAAGTSTGGTANKRFGRVGDSPIIGAGTYADNRSCAVSATGHGEYFIRHVVAYNICARMLHSGATLAESADKVINGELADEDGDGGVIALDAEGNIATPFNTPGMYRASIDRDGKLEVKIYGDE
ncbi:MAG TPA: isoaspartyl peptidase/L-asparaginase [Wenzhouxiangellaceae bacterium]|nr:isoaspartyl peptidase/L-asparaginase [Wenzhouxiangellaceae bacterium]